MNDGPVDVAELHAPFTSQEVILREAIGLGADVDINPSGGALAANTMMAAGLVRIVELANRVVGRHRGSGGGPRHLRPLPATEPDLRLGGKLMGAERVAVVGCGQTRHQATRGDVSIAGLVREAAMRALEDAGMTWSDIDAVVVGKAPDFFEGLMMPELYLAEALGAVGKPMLRVHTAGSVGGSTAIVASSLVASGIHKRVLTVAFEKQSESEAMWALSLPIPFSQKLVAGAGGFFAPHIRAYMRRSGAPDDTGILVALKDRLNACKNPFAHLHQPHITYESIRDSMMLWDPIRYDETCPSSDGAFAMVLADEATGDASPNPAWIHGSSLRSEATMAAGRDHVNPQAGRDCAADLYQQAGITNPREQIDVAEVYVPVLLVRAHVAGEPGLRRAGRGLEADRVRGHRHGRRHPLELLRRRAVDQPHRGLRDDPLRRGRHAGPRPVRRPPGGWRPHGPRSRLRWRRPVLRHVDRR